MQPYFQLMKHYCGWYAMKIHTFALLLSWITNEFDNRKNYENHFST